MVSARKHVREAIRRLEIEDGDIVLVKRDSIPGSGTTAERVYLNSFAEILGNTGREKCVIIIVNDFEDIRTLKTHDMMEHGWVKLEGV